MGKAISSCSSRRPFLPGRLSSADRLSRQGVLLIALEDSERRIHARLEQLKIIGTDKLIIFTRWAKGKHALEDLRIILRCHPEVRTVIIDPIVKFIDLLDFDFNEYGGAYDRLTPIKDILDGLHVAGIFSHHCKKSVSELDAFDDLLGSTGWGAACDTRLVLRRERGSDEGTLVAGGRDVLHSESALLFDGDRGWQYQGTVADVRISEERKQILELLDEAGPLSVTEVSKRLEKNYSTIRTLVQKLMKSGSLIHEGKKVTLATRKSVVNVVSVAEEEEGKTTETTESIETTGTIETIEKREEDDSLSSRARARKDTLEGIKQKLSLYRAEEVLERARRTLEQVEGTEGET